MLNKIKKLKGFTPHLLVRDRANYSLSNRKGEGFTLIELLVVIAIIGLLSTLAIVALDSAREKARDSKRVTDIKQIQTALEIYFNDAEGYAGGAFTLGDATHAVLCWSSDNAFGARDDGFRATITTDCDADPTTYMGQVPENPLPNGASYEYSGLADGTGCSLAAAPCKTYEITFTLEGTVNELSSGPQCAKPEGIISGSCPP